MASEVVSGPGADAFEPEPDPNAGPSPGATWLYLALERHGDGDPVRVHAHVWARRLDVTVQSIERSLALLADVGAVELEELSDCRIAHLRGLREGPPMEWPDLSSRPVPPVGDLGHIPAGRRLLDDDHSRAFHGSVWLRARSSGARG